MDFLADQKNINQPLLNISIKLNNKTNSYYHIGKKYIVSNTTLWIYNLILIILLKCLKIKIKICTTFNNLSLIIINKYKKLLSNISKNANQI